MENKGKKWYQKKRYIVGLAVLAVIAVIGLNSNKTNSTSFSVQGSTYAQQTQGSANSANFPSYLTWQTNTTTRQNNILSDSNTYTNVSGNTIHSPAYTEKGQAPDGASAQCGDGTYSFSAHRQGACSHHGGVSRWLHEHSF